MIRKVGTGFPKKIMLKQIVKAGSAEDPAAGETRYERN